MSKKRATLGKRVLFSVLLMLAAVWVIQFFGGSNAFASSHHHAMQPNFSPHQPHVTRGPHHMSLFHYIGSLLSLVFWLSVGIFVFLWIRKRRSSRPLYSVMTDAAHNEHMYTQTYSPPDFLDEWERKQTKLKEETSHGNHEKNEGHRYS
ncbi:hypothetical protein [Aneurinibacillus sp. REN35]|uniref:hypothetical protein n=1 Tax=Aneurinibacillus sp. REN35 TaxID=3237286 RepID=UPI0035271A19